VAQGRQYTYFKPSIDPAFTGGNAGIGTDEEPLDELKKAMKITAFLWVKSTFKCC